MRKALTAIILASLLAAPAEAASWQDQAIDSRPGAFLGARLKLPLGHQAEAKPRAELAFAPTQSRISSGGLVRTRIGEGLAFGITPKAKPTLTLAGMRADTALGLTRRSRSNAEQKLGVSTGGWVAIGVGAAVVIAGVAYLAWAEHVRDCGAARTVAHSRSNGSRSDPPSASYLGIHRNMLWVTHDPLHPGDDGRVERKVEVGLVRDMRVGEQANVADADPIADQPIPIGETLVH